MNRDIKNLILITLAYALLVWVLLPGGACWLWGRYSLIRLDPQVSTDYNCIFVEGHTQRAFVIPWLSRKTPLDYLRIRYTPNASHQEYGIMFVDPKTMACAAFQCCAKWPAALPNRLDSPLPILDWMRSQPASAQSASHTNDAREVYLTIQALSRTDLEHFALPPNHAFHNFVIGHQAITSDRKFRWLDGAPLILLWMTALGRRSQSKKFTLSSPPKADTCKLL